MDKVSNKRIGLKDILWDILSYRDRVFNSNLPIGHSIGQFVLDKHMALKRHIYRTFSLFKSAKSYLMVKLKNIATHIVSNCISATCLLDGYLTVVHCKNYKTPKLLGNRDNTTVLNPVHI